MNLHGLSSVFFLLEMKDSAISPAASTPILWGREAAELARWTGQILLSPFVCSAVIPLMLISRTSFFLAASSLFLPPPPSLQEGNTLPPPCCFPNLKWPGGVLLHGQFWKPMCLPGLFPIRKMAWEKRLKPFLHTHHSLNLS